MRPLLQHVQRSFLPTPSFVVPKPSRRGFSSILGALSKAPSVCLQCQYRASVTSQSSRNPSSPSRITFRRRNHQPSGNGKPGQDETPEERLARVRADIALREQQEQERIEKERQEKERLEKERLERERQQKEAEERRQQEWEKERQERKRLQREQQAANQKRPAPDVIELPPSTVPPSTKTQPSPIPDAAELASSNTHPSTHDSKAPTRSDSENQPQQKPTNDDVERVPEDQLPSHHQAQRWGLSKRFQEFMDDVLPKLALVTQKVNTFTGTDYSGIEALKQEIKGHEQLVRTRRAAIDEKKEALDIALSQQASAQKEVVALLERKHSWSDRDLERYMSLIRSEHINDQAVREAKEAIKQAENALEEAQSQLEKRERAQYHEEQIWSDTIRRNSTWVTFGLMGLNIFLLLATMVLIEPWRRRRMVREIKSALEAQTAAAQALPGPSTDGIQPMAAPISTASVVREADQPFTTPASPAAADLVDVSATEQHIEPLTEAVSITEASPTTSRYPVEPAKDTTPGETTKAPTADEPVVPLSSMDISEEAHDSSSWTMDNWQQKVAYIAKDIVSDRTISMRRVDYTAAVLQGAAAGAVITATIVAMIIGR